MRAVPPPAGLGVLLCAVLLAAPAGAVPYRHGDPVLVTGLVSDAQGRPLAGVQVVFEAARSGFSVRAMGREPRHLTRVAATTDASGEYRLEWAWDNYYNTFAVKAVLPYRKPAGERLRVLASEDLSRRLLEGSPVVAGLTVADVHVLEAWREFQAALDTADKRRIYEEVGRPDHVQELLLGDSAEVSWWYFQQGRVYRFREGRLEHVTEFAPVTPF